MAGRPSGPAANDGSAARARGARGLSGSGGVAPSEKLARQRLGVAQMALQGVRDGRSREKLLYGLAQTALD